MQSGTSSLGPVTGQSITTGKYSCTCMESDYTEYFAEVYEKEGVLYIKDGVVMTDVDSYVQGLTDLSMFRIG